MSLLPIDNKSLVSTISETTVVVVVYTAALKK
jgi:hypothetical protein